MCLRSALISEKRKRWVHADKCRLKNADGSREHQRKSARKKKEDFTQMGAEKIRVNQRERKKKISRRWAQHKSSTRKTKIVLAVMAAGIPVLAVAPKNSEIALIVSESECGIVVEPGDVQALVSAIIFLKHNPERRKQMAINSRVAFENRYTIENGLKKYLAIFNEVL